MEDIKIVGVVKFNSGEAYVLNRNPIFKYERIGNLLCANDGGFYSTYRYEAPSGRFKAFGGRRFELPMKDGSITVCNGQWWDGGQSQRSKELDINIVGCTISTIDSLKKCYVFCGGGMEEEYLKKIRFEYSGCVYPYYDYEKVIKFDDVRKKLWRSEDNLKKINKHIIKNAHNLSVELKDIKKRIRSIIKSMEL